MHKGYPALFCATLALFSPSYRSVVERIPATPPKITEVMVEHYLREAGINKAAELFRKVETNFRARSLPPFREVARLANLPAHERWLKGLAGRWFQRSPQWRGVGTIILGGQAADLELHLSSGESCLQVEAFVRLNGQLTALSPVDHCAKQMYYLDGDYYLSWPTYQQLFSRADLALLSVSLPQAKAEAIRYWIDGENEWQTAPLTWTPVSPTDRVVRIHQISSEITRGGQ